MSTNFTINRSLKVIEEILASESMDRYDYRKSFLITSNGPEDAPADTGKYRHRLIFSTPNKSPPRTSTVLVGMSDYPKVIEDKLRQRGEIITNRDRLYYLSHAAKVCQEVDKPIIFIPISIDSFEIRSDDERVLERVELLLSRSGMKYKAKNYTKYDSDSDDDSEKGDDDEPDIRDRMLINAPIYGLLLM